MKTEGGASAAANDLPRAWPATVPAPMGAKLRTLPGTAWLLAGAAAPLAIAVDAIVAANTHVTPTGTPGSGTQSPPTAPRPGNDLGQAVYEMARPRSPRHLRGSPPA